MQAGESPARAAQHDRRAPSFAPGGPRPRLLRRHQKRGGDRLDVQRAVEKLGAIRVGTEPDPHGRGVNYVFLIEAPPTPTGASGSWGAREKPRSIAPVTVRSR